MPSHRSQMLIDGIRGQTTGFQVYAIANHNDAIEGYSWFRTIPGHEFLDGVLVHSA
jgi:hypothetical protein